ncbi:MAG: glycoside hydrolase family 3 C-terminal domain-containing protein, partial [Acidimicrobiia bacterium]
MPELDGNGRRSSGDDDLEGRVSALLSELTIDEKLSLCAGASYWNTKAVSRLGIAKMKVTDGPRGVSFQSGYRRCTAFPSGIAQAATWDEELLVRFGEAAAEEAKSVGAKVLLGPAINITRTPLNGRTFEYLSEDPLLNSRLTVSIVEGIQSRGVAACVKHFAANNQEKDRARIDARVSRRALEEIYLPAFRAAVEQADAWSVMAAYNAVNGEACCENHELLSVKLREEYGFRGLVMSDWYAAKRTTSTERCVHAGLNLEMPGRGSKYKTKNLRESLDEGGFTEEELDTLVGDLLRVMLLTGHIDGDDDPGSRNTRAHQALARRLAEESITLLKNENGLLPLDPGRSQKVAVIGPKADARNCFPLWGGSAGVWPPYEVTPSAGMRGRAASSRLDMVDSVEQADVVLVVVGLSHRPRFDSEGFDRESLDLPGEQNQLIEDTVATNPRTVVVLINGSPVAMPWADRVPAILECWYPGMEGGNAIARIVCGDVNPSGKLPVTFPRRLEDSPAHRSAETYPGDGETVHYEEDIFVGYRHFDHAGLEPLFPFGHGLSYTEFEYDG